MAAPKGNRVESGICGIYRITSPSGRIYIGQAVDIKLRFQKYFGGNCPGQPRLHASFQKYGANNHIFDVVETCRIDELLDRERFHQEAFNVIGEEGLNCKLTTTSDKSGRHSSETVERIRHANTGKVHSAEAKAKMRAAKLGRKMPENQRLKMVGKGPSDSAREKARASLIGNKHTTGCIPYNAKKIIDTSSGMIFRSTKSASEYIGVKQRTLKAWLSGQSPNKSCMEFA